MLTTGAALGVSCPVLVVLPSFCPQAVIMAAARMMSVSLVYFIVL